MTATRAKAVPQITTPRMIANVRSPDIGDDEYLSNEDVQLVKSGEGNGDCGGCECS